MGAVADSGSAPRMAVIACAVLEDEVRHFAETLGHITCFEFLPQGLHNEPPKLRTSLQEAIVRIEGGHPEVEAIALVYGLCSRGVEGVRSARCRIVLPRAHDCITLLLGSRESYDAYVARHPGTYWYSPGWNRCHVPPGRERYEKLLAEYRERFGEEDAVFLMEEEQSWFRKYNRAAYVHLGVACRPEDIEYTRGCAAWLGWSFDMQAGDSRLLTDLLAGGWDEKRFLVIAPGRTVRMTGDERIVESAPAEGG